MPKKIIFLTVTFAAISFAACTYKTINYEEVKRQVLCLNPADSISKKEAVTLAKKYFLEKRYGDRWSILSPYAYYYAPSKEWFVEFGSKYSCFSEGRYRYTLRIIVTNLGRIRTEAFCRY
jgi:hypothetical protein